MHPRPVPGARQRRASRAVEVTPTCPAPREQCIPVAFPMSLLDSMIRTQRAARNSHGVRVVGAAGRPRFMWRGLGGASQSHHLPGPAAAEGKPLPDSTMGFHGIGEERPACNPQIRGRPGPQGPRLRRTPRGARGARACCILRSCRTLIHPAPLMLTAVPP